jgi:hypothetical protein
MDRIYLAQYRYHGQAVVNIPMKLRILLSDNLVHTSMWTEQC